jgi:hypothetical protein
MIDCCEQDRKKSLRRVTYRFERGIKVIARPCDRKRWAWQAYVWKKYGLAAWDIAKMWNEQAGKCPICRADLNTKRWVIEHRHVVGWKKMPPHMKRKYFRGVVCNWCNHRVLSICERAGRERIVNVLAYLTWF